MLSFGILSYISDLEVSRIDGKLKNFKFKGLKLFSPSFGLMYLYTDRLKSFLCSHLKKNNFQVKPGFLEETWY
jgi:hypothetical protein